jgi:hypothetical protein
VKVTHFLVGEKIFLFYKRGMLLATLYIFKMLALELTIVGLAPDLGCQIFLGAT